MYLVPTVLSARNLKKGLILLCKCHASDKLSSFSVKKPPPELFMCMCLLLSGHRLIFHPPLLSLQLSNSYLFSFSSLDPGFSFSYFLVSHCLTFSLDIGGSSSVRFRLKSTPAGRIRQSWCRPAARPHSCVRLTGCGAQCILLHCTPLCFGDFQDGGMDLEEDNGGRGDTAWLPLSLHN